MAAARQRGPRTYEKPPLSADDLVTRMVDRGLQVPDRDRARRYLRHIGYFRLSPYTIPFQQDGSDHTFVDGTTFDQVLDLYAFDRALRLLVLDAVERVEVAVRAAITDHMSTHYGDPHWYTHARHFSQESQHDRLLKIVHETCQEKLRTRAETAEGSLDHRSALEHYLLTYGSPDLPPSWLMVETLTLGQLSALYRNLQSRADQSAVARSLGLNEPLLSSWLQTYVRIRNICAHHGRLWNVGLGVYPKIPRSPSVSWLEHDQALPERSRRRLYPALVSLQSVLDTVSPRSSWAGRLHHLIESRPAMNMRGMGVPEDWSADPFWSRHLG